MNDLKLNQKLIILSKTYATIREFFGFWYKIPNYDIEQEYDYILEKVLNSNNRIDFSLVMKQFIAGLENGHSFYNDTAILERLTRYKRGFRFHFLKEEGKWVVVASHNPDVSPGEIVESINSIATGDLYLDNKQYISGSSERERMTRFQFETLFLPTDYAFQFEGGQDFSITKNLPNIDLNINEQTETRVIEKEKIAYIKIPGFYHEKFEQKAIEYVQHFKDYQNLIVDIRDNQGGSTPLKLIRTLMNKPFRYWNEGTTQNLAFFKYNYEVAKQMIQSGEDDPQNAFVSSLENNFYFNYPTMSWRWPIQQPKGCLFNGNLYILTDRYVNSAAEDFLVGFKDNNRATIIGEPTNGSTGQPYYKTYFNSVNVSIGMKIAFFPDGSPFEGIGILPDIEINPSLDDYLTGTDRVLDYTTDLASEH